MAERNYKITATLDLQDVKDADRPSVLKTVHLKVGVSRVHLEEHADTVDVVENNVRSSLLTSRVSSIVNAITTATAGSGAILTKIDATAV